MDLLCIKKIFQGRKLLVGNKKNMFVNILLSF